MSTLAFSAGAVWGKVWPILLAIVYFGFLILSHEIGHFTAAKSFKVKVNEFSMGMGPRIFKKKKGETTYSVKALPFGGSVLMEGEDDESADPRAFGKQKAWKRLIILLAGAFMNLVCGMIIMAVIVGMDPKTMVPQVAQFGQEPITSAQGLEVGDVLYKINGRRVRTWMDLNFLLNRSKTGLVDLVVKRQGKTLGLGEIQFKQGETADGVKYYGCDFTLYGVEKGERSLGLFLKETVGESISVARMVYLSLFDMVTGKFKLREISGPIGVVTMLSNGAQQAQEQATSGNKAQALFALMDLLLLFGMISINIGIMNLLPLPALDGGRIFFTLVEMIFRKPVPKKFESYVHAAGFALLMLFMAVVSFSDIWALIKGHR
ncbi:MAG: site-2 protease family protein [Oscillospiraceae bacterium]|jgi:regulator of sigma E protease|nr:site-2 protease family protein [Oscillospiraceae bacterium]